MYSTSRHICCAIQTSVPNTLKEPRGGLKMAELARVSGTSRSTIHFYRNLGLIPAPERRGPRLHLYGQEHVRRLRQIAELRLAGKTLEELKERFREQPPDPRARALPGVSHGEASPRRRGEKAALRETLLLTAARAFVEQGYDAVHVTDIARAAGIGKAKLYEYFASKEALFVDCLDHLREAVFSREQRQGLGEGLSFEDEGRLRAAAVIYRFRPYRMMTNLLAHAAYGSDEALAGRAHVALKRMVTDAKPMLERAVAKGDCRPVDTELLAYMTWGALLAIGDRLSADDLYTPEQALETYLDFIQRGMGTQVSP